MEILLIVILLGWLSDEVFGVSEKEKKRREWAANNIDRYDVLRG